MDDLGRVVIPKEIRRTMRIREGDPLEIYTDREGEVIFKKYSPIGELTNFASQYAETLHKVCLMDVIICDRDAVIACAGVPKREYLEKKPVWLYAMCIVSGLVTSALNSVVLFAYLSGMDYANLFRVPAEYWLTRIPAFSSTLVTSVVLATAALPVARAIRRLGVGRKIVPYEVKE